MSDTTVRPARTDDVPRIHALVHELAAYEREPDSCTVTVDQLRTALFGDAPALFAHVAVVDDDVVGTAIWFLNYSTWDGAHGIYLEDLFVRPDVRGRGAGRDLLATLARLCAARGYSRLTWSVLDWNAPSIAFYESLGARPMDGWSTYRLSGPALAALGAPPTP
ncbi:GNAT family N-acetyltransferase [Aeromicrobium marinum]|nr:GNAT family N-acetyltransferase [Aeromicrobium marinum]